VSRSWLDPRRPLSVAGDAVHAVKTLVDAGVVRPIRPDKMVEAGLLLAAWGFTPAAGYAVSARLCPDEAAVVDEAGTVTFAELQSAASALAAGLSASGVAPGQPVGVLCRNSRYAVLATAALSQLGATALYANTGFAAPALRDVLKREGARVLLYDEEFAALATEADLDVGVSAHDGDGVDELIATHEGETVDPPGRPWRMVILTSGTTGTPKGAPRSAPVSVDPAVALLSRIPLRTREATVVAAPVFHAWGMAHLSLGLLLSSTLVLRRRFDAVETLRDVERTGATAMAVVPVMLQRMLDAEGDWDTSSLRVVAASGSALPGDLATRFMDRFGDVLYNLYGSTEVAWASIATPEDLRAARGTGGRPPRGTEVRLYDGRIFVGNDMLFEGYTTGGDKERRDGLMATGDMGRFDDEGRLFVDGRDDDMVVSGGENVFPREVEDVIAKLPDVAEVVVVGVADERFGARLAAYVVPAPGREPTTDAIRDAVRASLAAFKVPRDVVIVDALPRNATGKVVRSELPPVDGADARG
jgi:fatty-acyl-CoA synthase